MNRRLILIASIILIALIGAYLYFALTKNNNGQPNTIPSVFKSLLPFSSPSSPQTINQNLPPATIGQTNQENTPVVKRLKHLTTEPTAGNIILEKNIDVIVDRVKISEKAFYVRYIERATGHIFDIKTDAVLPIQISNTTIPKIYEATFLPGGNSLVARFLNGEISDQIITYYITLKNKASSATSTTKTSMENTVAVTAEASKTELKEATGAYLEANIKEIALTPTGKKILSLVYTADGSRISLLNTGETKSRTLLSFSLREWLLTFSNEIKAVVTTKPSGITNGYAYTLDLATGTLRKIIGGIAGLTLLPNKDGNTYLGAGTPNGIVKLFAYFDKEGNTELLPLSTFPEKCIWKNIEKNSLICAVPKSISMGTYPDDWYKGKTTFTDELWQIDIKTKETQLISSLDIESGQAIDAINFKISSDDKYITFINKKDLTLWGLDLNVKKL